MTSRLIRRVAIALLAVYAFGQAGVALAACGMDRGAMAQAMTMPAGDTCNDCAKAGADAVTPLCIAHCTADLQLTGAAPDVVVAPAVQTPTILPIARFRSPPLLAYLPPGTLPRRILLHSFQI
jgi:hypothetical protein